MSRHLLRPPELGATSSRILTFWDDFPGFGAQIFQNWGMYKMTSTFKGLFCTTLSKVLLLKHRMVSAFEAGADATREISEESRTHTQTTDKPSQLGSWHST